jgi:lipopolysaccharide/colanic/teichoic acid biosynthesis glycosyltransferase
LAAKLLHGERPALRREWRAFVTYLLIMDGLTVLFSLWLAYHLRISSGILEYYGPANREAYRMLSILSLPLWIAVFGSFSLYRRDDLLGGTKEYQQLFKACTAGIIAIVLLSFLWRDEFTLVSRGWLITAWALCTGLMLAQRFVSRRLGYWLRRHGRLTNRVLLVGANDQGLAMAQQWMSSPTSGIHVVGFLDDFKPYGTRVGDGTEVIGRPRNLHELVGQHQVDEVVIVPSAIAWETFEELLVDGNCDGDYTLRLSPGFYEIMSTGVAVTNRQFVPLLTVQEARLVGVDAAAKAALDYGLGVPLLFLTLPAITLLALVIKLGDRDLGIFDRSAVVLPDGNTFSMLRMRTRRPDGTSSPLGHWLEQTELDRAPQVFHVISGQMSLVGPRAQLVSTHAAHDRSNRNQRTLKPGIIGPWSVWTYWSPGDERDLDLYYIRNWTPWLDLQILFQSVAVTVRRSWRWVRQEKME